MQHLEYLRLIQHIHVKVAVGLLSLEVGIISLIFLLLIQDLSNLFQLVVVDIQVLSIERVSLGLLLCMRSRVRVLKADESVDCLVILSIELNGFNLTKTREVLTQLILSSGWREVLYIEIASLL